MKNTTRNKVNLLFSSFLVIGYIVCTFFFSSLAAQVSGTLGGVIQALMLILFGLLMFYATRVGDGKQVKRFSLAVLLMIVVPCAYVIAASFIPALPFHDQLAPMTTVLGSGVTAGTFPIITMLACVALGYGIPYTFLSGYEIADDEAEAPAEEPAMVEGGLAEELAEVTETEPAAEEAAEEAVIAESEEAEADTKAETDTEPQAAEE